ncbi:hypothetical protein NFI96_007797, partial [Prochilodus magdalenae]
LEVSFTDVGQALSSDSEGQFTLPPRMKCASHTLNLISSNDVEKWLPTNSESRVVYRSVTAKSSALWTKTSRSSIASELVEDVIKRKLIVPTATRWNSFYDALYRITEIPITELNTIFSQLGLKCITEKEYQFLREYCTVLKPLTTALDILQGEDNRYYGTLLPTLEILMSKTLELQNERSRMTVGLPDAIVQAIKVRFSTVLDSKDALLAAVSLPKFKLRWFRDDERRVRVRVLLTTECREESSHEPMMRPAEQTPSISSQDDFFSFEKEDTSYTAENIIKPEHWRPTSPILYSLFTHDCVPIYGSNTIIKYVDDTTVIGLIRDNDKTAYRDEVKHLSTWCHDNNQTLNTQKTKEIIIDLRRSRSQAHPPVYISGAAVEQVTSFKFLGTHISSDLTWSLNSSVLVKKAQQRLYFLRSLKKVHLSPRILVNFYRCTIESILTNGISVWYGNCCAADRKALQRVVKMAQRITGTQLPTIQDIYHKRCLGRARNIIKDVSHPNHGLFTLLSPQPH